MRRFPGLTAAQMEELLWARVQNCIPAGMEAAVERSYGPQTSGVCCIPLPRWLPPGFAVEQVVAKVGVELPIDSMAIRIVYSKRTPTGKKKIFVIEGGFEFGGGPYEDYHEIKSGIGTIRLYYEPLGDSLLDGNTVPGLPIRNYVITDWCDCDQAGYPKYMYVSMPEFLRADGLIQGDEFEMISLDDTRKIIASLEKL